MNISRADFFNVFKDGPNDEEINNEILRIKSYKAFAAHAERNGRMYSENYFTGAKDCDLISHATTPIEYWRAILAVHKPKQHLSLFKIAEHLATIRPHVQPSESRLYIDVKNSLKTINGHLVENEGSLHEKTSFNLPTAEQLEALRIYGNAKDGFGTMPAGIAKMLEKAKLVWIVVPTEHRKVPKMWQDYMNRQQRPDLPADLANLVPRLQSQVERLEERVAILEQQQSSHSPNKNDMGEVPSDTTSPSTSSSEDNDDDDHEDVHNPAHGDDTAKQTKKRKLMDS